MNKHIKTTNSWLSSTVLGFGLTSFFNDFSHEMTTAILPLFIKDLVGNTQAPFILGIMSGVSNGASTAMKFIAGPLSDIVISRKLLLLIGYTITPLFVGLIGFAHTAWIAIVYKTLAWLGRGLREPVRDAWIASVVESQNYGKAFGFNRALDTLGGIAGPLFAYLLLATVSLKTIFVFSFIPGTLSVVSLFYFVQDTAPLSSTNKTQQSLNIFARMAQLPENFKHYVLSTFVFRCGNFNKTLLIYRAQEMLTGTTSSYLVATGWAILLYILFNIIRAVSEYSLGAISDKASGKSRKNLLILAGFSLFGSISIGLIFVTTQWSLWMVIFILAGISAAAVTTLGKAYAADLLPTQLRGTGYGLLQSVEGIGDLISSLTVGLLWTFLGPWAGFSYAASLSFGAALLLMRSTTNNNTLAI
ncbi:MFS transporter [Candidatus Dependentiae bacterium]|nr:MFS transporter [Candidatus Dependentiae bacterium]